MSLKFINCFVYKNKKLVKTDFAVIDGKFSFNLKKIKKYNQVFDLKGARVYPGLCDIHTHGALGFDFNVASEKEMNDICEFYKDHGCTYLLATIMTDDENQMKKQLSLVAKVAKSQKIIKGIHLEGPFLSKEYKGAMPLKFLQKPSYKKFLEFQKSAEGLIKLITIAPELPGAIELIKKLTKEGVRVSLGHSGANFEESSQAIEAGAVSFTHLFNAMKPIEHHNPSIIVKALQSENYIETILDGKHLNPNIVSMIYKIKGEKMIAITDSISPTGLPNGKYKFAGEIITLKDGDARMPNGTRAGSVLNIFDGLKNLSKFINKKEEDCLVHFTEAPTKMLGTFSKFGSVEEGKIADFIVVKNGKLINTFIS